MEITLYKLVREETKGQFAIVDISKIGIRQRR